MKNGSLWKLGGNRVPPKEVIRQRYVKAKCNKYSLCYYDMSLF